MSPKSSSAITMPSPSVNGVARCFPSGETIALKHPPRSAFCNGPAGMIDAICASVSQAVALTTKHPDSSA